MTTTFLNIKDDVKKIITDLSADYIVSNDIARWANRAQNDIAIRTLFFEREFGIALEAKKELYPVPADLLYAKSDVIVRWDMQPVYYKPKEFFRDYWMFKGSNYGQPYFYTYYDSRLRLYPTPAAASLSSTLTVGIIAGTSNIPVADTSQFREAGIVIFADAGNEQVAYNGRSTTTGAGNLQVIIRGFGGTVDQAHSISATVKQADLRLFYHRRPKDLAADADITEVPDEYADALSKYIAYEALMVMGKYEAAGVWKAEYNSKVINMRDEYAKKVRDELPCIRSEDDYLPLIY